MQGQKPTGTACLRCHDLVKKSYRGETWESVISKCRVNGSFKREIMNALKVHAEGTDLARKEGVNVVRLIGG